VRLRSAMVDSDAAMRWKALDFIANRAAPVRF